MQNSQPDFEAGYSARFQPSSPCPWTSTWFGKTLPSPLSRSPCSPLFARPTPQTVSLIQDGGISFRIVTRSNPILLQYFGGRELQIGFWHYTPFHPTLNPSKIENPLSCYFTPHPTPPFTPVS